MLIGRAVLGGWMLEQKGVCVCECEGVCVVCV